MNAPASGHTRAVASLGAYATALLCAACSGPTTSPAPGSLAAGQPPAAGPGATTGAAPAAALSGRTGQLVNPEASTMVFLYYDLAGIQPPIETWVEDDSRVKYAAPIDRAAKRAAVRSELEAGMPAVRGVGRLQLTLNANLSDYDPSYGEFTVGAFAPSSVFTFDALGQKVSLQFDNARSAQTWKVPAPEAQAIRDRIGYARNVQADATLQITGVRPGPGGGTITANVLEYELRNAQDSHVIGRVRVAP